MDTSSTPPRVCRFCRSPDVRVVTVRIPGAFATVILTFVGLVAATVPLLPVVILTKWVSPDLTAVLAITVTITVVIGAFAWAYRPRPRQVCFSCGGIGQGKS